MKFSAPEIVENAVVLREIKAAWEDSVPSISGGHEEGGFIVIDEFENLSVVRWEKGKQNEIILPPHRNCFVDGKEIVASFHTHPNIGRDFQQEPSLTDIRAVRDDPNLKGENYTGEFVISKDVIYLIQPSGEIVEIGNTKSFLKD
ncbi:MAG TPA: hypothetical protein VK892_09160 [Pyrinomonadaceae bacterium]|nr:hypothetical protein [Pyrinomonadaceae bacterium]